MLLHLGRDGGMSRHVSVVRPCAWSVAVLSACLAATVHAQQAPRLDAIVLKGQALRADVLPVTAQSFDQELIRDSVTRQPQELLNRVAGVSVDNYNLGGIADSISVRGFSGGGHGGSLGFMLDGIPLNEAMSHDDGYADLNVVIPLELERMTVYKGPSSVLYGNFNRAGLVEMQTRKGGNYQEVDASGGSFGTGDLQGAVGAENEAGQFNAAMQLGRSNGFRDDSRFDKGTVAARYNWFVNPDLDIAFSGRAYSGRWDAGSYVTQDRFDRDPYSVDPRVQGDGGKKDFFTGRVDVNHALSEQLKLLSFAYATHQTLTRWSTYPKDAMPDGPWSQSEDDYKRTVLGAGMNLNGRHMLGGGSELNWTSGFELYRETTDYLRFDGEQDRSRAGLEPGSNRRYRLDSTGLFGEVQWVPTPVFRPTAGLRFDTFKGKCSVRGRELADGRDCSSTERYKQFSPKVGFSSQVASWLDLRSSWSRGFALPPVEAIYKRGVDLKPNTFDQIEVGAKFDLLDSLEADLAWYRLTSSNEIGTVGGVAQNFGKTRRDGVELSLGWEFVPDWHLAAVTAWSDSEVLRNPDPHAVGARVANVPRSTSRLEVSYRPELGLGGFAAVRHVGRQALNVPDAELREQRMAGAYTVFDAGLSYRFKHKGTHRLYLNVANVFDKKYASSAFMISGQPLYGVGAPRSVMLGAQLSF
ncbi:TPA: TonB-dependent receptor [Escherichia coli]|nr:TonB-dependent receptor [Escherichia coli]